MTNGDRVRTNGITLLPCPFCGGEADVFFTEESGMWDAQCQACGAMPYVNKTEEEAVEAWNTRHETNCGAKVIG